MQQAKLIQDIRMYASRALNTGWAPPDRLSLNLTLRCNLTCSMCTTCYDSPELSLEEIKRLIDEAAEWGVEVFNPLGGEPFMRSDIEEILRYATQCGFFVTITTNATLISPTRAKKLALIPSDRLHLNISLDGNQTSNDRIRGEGAFNKAIQGYKNIRSADAAVGNSRRKILTNTILHAANFDSFEEILDAQAELGFDGVQILNLFRSDEQVSGHKSDFMWFKESDMPKLKKLCGRLAERASKGSLDGYRIQNTKEELMQIPSYYTEALSPLDAPCWAGWKELYINADGQAIMCDGKLDFLNGSFGSVREKSLRQLWSSAELRSRRSVVKQCQTPCIQSCYLRPKSDDIGDLVKRSAQQISQRLRPLLPVSRKFESRPNSVLQLEFSDVMPGDYEGRESPVQRWRELTRRCPQVPNSENWLHFRDSGLVDFGRGFMGFEILKHILSELKVSGLKFETIAVGWRGDALLHPEIKPMLESLMEAVRDGLADRLRIETTGLFMRPDIAALAANPIPQDWVLDWDTGNGSGIEQLEAFASPSTRIIIKQRAMTGVDYNRVSKKWPTYQPVVGSFPFKEARCHWLVRVQHDTYVEDSIAESALMGAANILSVDYVPPAPNSTRLPMRSFIVSWDAKVTSCPSDTQLHNQIGEIDSERMIRIWNRIDHDAPRCFVHGKHGGFCYQCSILWSEPVSELI